MRKNIKILVLILFVSSFSLPFIPVMADPQTAQDDKVVFRLGVQITAAGGDWDPVIRRASNADVARMCSLEGFVRYPANWEGDYSELEPVLATDWDFEYWPAEQNTKGFVNGGGIKAVNLTLRENVTFHDGSKWNASVAKWNLDRIIIVSGNLTGNGDMLYYYDFWEEAIDYVDFYTPSWNMSKYIDKMPSYNGIVATNPVLNGTFPKYENVTILEAGGPNGGGKIRINFNDWASFSVWELLATNPQHYILMISKEAYADYWDKPIYGFGENPSFPQDETFQHLVGTGPYIFDHWDAVAQTGKMVKNENYWNKEALESVGWFEIDELQFVLFTPDADGTQSRNLAMKTGAIDMSEDTTGFNFVYSEVMAQADITYYENPIGDYPFIMVLNCINDTEWKTNYDAGDPYVPYQPNGIPRLLRKAISYAFNYEGFIQTAYSGRATRMKSYLGNNMTYANYDIPMPYLNLTIAREAILAQYPTECATRNLNETSTDQDWQNVANSNPIYTVDFYWDTTALQQVLQDYMATALHNIGMAYYDDSAHELASVWIQILYVPGGSFSAQAWPTTFAIAPTEIGHAHINAYFKYPGPYTVGWNLAFNYLDNVTDWIDQIYFSNRTIRQECYDNIGLTLQDYQYPWMWICQGDWGWVYRREWEVREFEFYTGMPRIVGDFTHIKYVGWEPTPPAIPGFSVYIMLSVSLASSVGLIYVMMRKRK